MNIHTQSLVAHSGVSQTWAMKKASKTRTKRGAKTDTAARGPYFSPEDLLQRGTAGVYLRQWRALRKMTIAALAESADVADGTITGIENDDVGFTNATLGKLSVALGCTVAQLVGVNPLENEELWPLLDNATTEQRRIIVNHAKMVVKREF